LFSTGRYAILEEHLQKHSILQESQNDEKENLYANRKSIFGNAVSTKAGTVPQWAKSITADGTRHSTVRKPSWLPVSQAVSELFTGISGAAYQHQRPLLHFTRLHGCA
jgi:hypothetical protein